MKGFTVAIFATLMAGCGMTGTEPVVGYSGFDNAKTVSISPNGNACKQMICTGVGAQWSSDNPDNVIFIVQIFNDYAAITGVKLNIDGREIALASANNITDFETVNSTLKESSKGFVAPLSVVHQILNAKKVWLRVYTPTGYIEDPIVDKGIDSKAFHGLQRFIKAINS